MSEKSNSFSVGEIILIGGLGIALISRMFDRLLAWAIHPNHQNLVIGIGSILILILLLLLIKWIKKQKANHSFENSILGKVKDSAFCGVTDKGEEVWIKPRQRAMHTQVVGTTNAGKTESVIIPWAVQDIAHGRGILLIDGKADNSLLDKLWAYTKLTKREKDFRLFSLSRQKFSFQFNPLLGGTAEEITERVFNSFEFENPYYRSLQYEVMSQILRIFEASKVTPTFQRLHQAINRPSVLRDMIGNVADVNTRIWFMDFVSLSQKEKDERTSGLLSAIGQFSYGANAKLFNPEDGAITIDEALSKNQIVYFQLPVLLSPFIGKATGKLVLQSLQAAVANRHRSKDGNKEFFSVFLDDFSEYLYPGFVSILNKSRSANVGIVFAHQALGDINVLGDAVANSILTNSNVKVFMRGNDPTSAEYFSKVIGTKTSTKFTERQKRNLLGVSKSGDMSVRDVEEFFVHPNIFKKELGIGDAFMHIPHEKGSKTIRIKFSKIDDHEPSPMEEIEKKMMPLLEEKEEKQQVKNSSADTNGLEQSH